MFIFCRRMCTVTNAISTPSYLKTHKLITKLITPSLLFWTESCNFSCVVWTLLRRRKINVEKKKTKVATMLRIVYQRRQKISTLNSRWHIVVCMVGAKIITQIDCETNNLKALLSSMHLCLWHRCHHSQQTLRVK